MLTSPSSAATIASLIFEIGYVRIARSNGSAPAISVPYSLSRVAGALLSFIALNLLDDFGAGAVFTGSAVILVIVSLDVALLGPRSTGRSLEVVAQRDGAVAGVSSP